MDLFTILAILITLTAVFSYLNFRFIGLPVTIGVMFISLIVSLCVNFLGYFDAGITRQVSLVLEGIHFDKTLLHGMLSFLLFAGALEININDLLERKWAIFSLATVGTLLSTLFIGTAFYFVLRAFGISMSYLYCLIFGALISPTDPIAVLGILKTAGVPKSLRIKISGESLFNDGVGIVVFLVLIELVTEHATVTPGHIALLFVQEAFGGALFGLATGYAAYRMLKSVDNYQVEVLITLALVCGGYALAHALHLSGPIAMVCAALLIGNKGRLFGMSDTTRHHLDVFWELVDEILNAVLFVLIGLEVLLLTFTRQNLFISLLVIPLLLLSRFVAIGIPMTILKSFRNFTPGAVRLLTWGGLRGGISVALALSLPAGPERRIILAVTYAVVVFSILVQGMTLKRFVKRILYPVGDEPAKVRPET